MKTVMAVVVGLIVALVLVKQVRDGARQRDELAALRTAIEAVRRAAPDLTPAVRLMELRQRAPVATSAPVAQQAGPVAEIPRAKVVNAEERQALVEGTAARAEKAFGSEGVDEDWARSTTRAIDGAIAGA